MKRAATRRGVDQKPRPTGGASSFWTPPEDVRPFLDELADAVAESILRDFERLERAGATAPAEKTRPPNP